LAVTAANRDVAADWLSDSVVTKSLHFGGSAGKTAIDKQAALSTNAGISF
jgi:hypothetical protein